MRFADNTLKYKKKSGKIIVAKRIFRIFKRVIEVKHILIVDDNKQNLVLMRTVFAQKFQVTPVLSGAQAIKFLESKSPDLILLDLFMPEMDGKETMAKIRENREWAEIPIFFITADDDDETKRECLQAGANGFITKPFIPEEVIKQIEQFLMLDD